MTQKCYEMLMFIWSVCSGETEILHFCSIQFVVPERKKYRYRLRGTLFVLDICWHVICCVSCSTTAVIKKFISCPNQCS